MRERLARKALYCLGGTLLFLAGWLMGNEKGTTEESVIHAVAWTTLEGATPEDFENFKRATADLVGVMPGLKRAWVGRLRQPLTQGDQQRTYGLVFEFDSVKTRETVLGTSTPETWGKLRDKIRVPGNDHHTTFDVVGE